MVWVLLVFTKAVRQNEENSQTNLTVMRQSDPLSQQPIATLASQSSNGALFSSHISQLGLGLGP